MTAGASTSSSHNNVIGNRVPSINLTAEDNSRLSALRRAQQARRPVHRGVGLAQLTRRREQLLPVHGYGPYIGNPANMLRFT